MGRGEKGKTYPRRGNGGGGVDLTLRGFLSSRGLSFALPPSLPPSPPSARGLLSFFFSLSREMTQGRNCRVPNGPLGLKSLLSRFIPNVLSSNLVHTVGIYDFAQKIHSYRPFFSHISSRLGFRSFFFFSPFFPRKGKRATPPGFDRKRDVRPPGMMA